MHYLPFSKEYQEWNIYADIWALTPHPPLTEKCFGIMKLSNQTDWIIQLKPMTVRPVSLVVSSFWELQLMNNKDI